MLLKHVSVDKQFYNLGLQYCNASTLQNFIDLCGSLPEHTCQLILSQVVSGLCDIHSQSIIHRDLKSENVFLHLADFIDLPTPQTLKTCLLECDPSDLNVVIGDFGLSREHHQDEVVLSNVGSFIYRAPEVVSQVYTKQCDIWAVGIIFFQMLTGRLPRSDELYNESKIRLPIKTISQQGLTLMVQCLNKDPKKRPTAEELRDSKYFHYKIPASS